MIYETNSPKQTKQIAINLAKEARAGDIFCLNGDLGAGKTVFAKGFAEGLSIKEELTSPTFTIVNEYKSGTLPLYHFDVYRIGSIYEMDDLGYEEMFFGDGVCLVEWAQLIKELIPDNAFYIDIEKDYTKDDNYRQIKIRNKW